MELEKRSAQVQLYDDNRIYIKLFLDKSKPFNSRKYDYESIDPKTFINGIKDDALLLLNHDRSKPITRLDSDRVQITYDNKAVELSVDLPNLSYTKDLKALAKEKVLEMSFGFRCLNETVKDRVRYINKLEISEISLLTVAGAYPSESRNAKNEDFIEQLVKIYSDIYLRGI